MFRRDGSRGDGPISLHLPGDQPCRILITDLESGTWHATLDGGKAVSLRVSKEAAAAWWIGRAGDWTISQREGD